MLWKFSSCVEGFMKVDHILAGFEELPKFTCYKEKNVKERKNGTRVYFNVVHKPNEAMTAVHDELIKLLTERLNPFHLSLPNAICITGVTPKSIFYRLERKRYITKLDLFHAYGSVKVLKLAEILKDLFPGWGTVKQIASFLKKYCCNEKLGLFWGAPASPLLFNLYAEKLIDSKIRDLISGDRYCSYQYVDYMRYVDDLIFYSRDVEIDGYNNGFLRQIRGILKDAGFLENQWKAKSVDRNSGSIVVLGRQLGCMGPAYQYEWRSFSHRDNVRRKRAKLRSAMDPFYRALPRRIVGLPTDLSEGAYKKSLQALEIEIYKASKFGYVGNPYSLVGKMMWFVDSVLPRGRELSRTEKKIVFNYKRWSIRTGMSEEFLKKLNL